MEADQSREPPIEALLRAQGVRCGYGRLEVLHAIDLSVGAGELVALLGANGAGKSTTLKALCGGLKPTAGEVEFRGERVTGTRPERMVARGAALVPEGRDIFARLSVEENLLLGAYLRRDKASVSADIEEAYGRFPALADRRGQVAGTLSGGEQQMLAIGRALVGRPHLVMLDEPSLGLSPKLVDQVFELVHGLRQEGMTILLVEQNTKHALQLADRGYVLAAGRVVLSGTAAELLGDEERLHAAYLGGTQDGTPKRGA